MKEPVIKVGILSDEEVRFELHGSFTSQHQHEFREGSYHARLSKNKIELESNGFLTSCPVMLILRPDQKESASFTLKEVTIGIGFHWQKKEDQTFRGALMLMSIENKIAAINLLPVEDYLVSVISSEMSATSSLEMLKAHAVISRSWLLAQIEKGHSLRAQEKKYQTFYSNEEERIVWYDREDHLHYDVCADDHCQRYQGITRASTVMVEEAVRSTTGEVLWFNNSYCDTRFSKCCGGVTELFENTWEPVPHPYLQCLADRPGNQPGGVADLTREDEARNWIMSIPEAFCNTSDPKVLKQVLNDYDQTTHQFYRWQVGYAGTELGKLILSRIGVDFGPILDMIPLQRGTSGRIIKLKIVGTKKTMIIGKELEIRKALSPTHLYSSAFIVEKVTEGEDLRFVLHGAGWGHGVGLCQIGAAVMGAKGYTYQEILSHYFRGAELKKSY